MRKEQREYIINKLQSAVVTRINKERKDRPVSYSKEDVAAYLEGKGVELTDNYYSKYVKMPPSQTHEDNQKYLDELSSRLYDEVDNMKTALMLQKDPDAIAMMNAALERIKGV